MKFCSLCGSELTLGIPEGDDRERHICDSCETIHYQNPKIVAGTLPIVGDKVLLCRRAIEPRKGFWTLPAGFMENEESVKEAARRETWEEACARTCQEELYTIISIPYISQVYMMYRAELSEPGFAAGPESLEVRLFSEEEIPWKELAFRTVSRTLELFFQDRATGTFPLHDETLE
ncbi:NUDIX hydrolase [Parendozoicomonas haliclonae]|uniref:Bifunctional nicotinamide mononucleotide adenylyltransferase/ADP-ribose pyrophosphatase n=1 Tax=Parendozoicomonas haliclonae TaxID=1960125 RepID=A0A1X7AQK1_9GAMM|nr:NUDIX hydrolase [Parendozoicomonas haliclonae]SMA50412.1 bifunctional nicotinamide mononucleotide adenylyltransferase/ADP-ribose pyrophosphatase [Parendozoicomonas haliclonae]